MRRPSSKEKGYEKLCRSLEPRMKALAARLTGSASDAEEVFQEAVLRVWEQLPGVTNVGGYFVRVVTNLSFAHWRTKQRERLLPGVSPDDVASSAGDQSSDPVEELGPSLRQALAALPPQQREALALKYFEELGYPEIGGLLGCTPATARSHVSKGIATLKTALGRLPEFRRLCREEEQ
jgi:RNA polymerase sigma factor (sigma-70 family)